jgi:hypothetical protein
MPRIDQVRPDAARALRAYEAAYRAAPDDLVRVGREGWYLTFDEWLRQVLTARLRPTPISLAVTATLRTWSQP